MTELSRLVSAAHEELLLAVATGATSWDDVYEWDAQIYHDRLESCYNNMLLSELVEEYVQNKYFKPGGS